LILRLFPLRQCSDVECASRKRPCLLFDIKRCIAPCVGRCTQEDYQKLVDGAIRLLKGQDKELIKELRSAMEEAAYRLDFEQAGELLRMITQIEHVTSVQHVDNPFAKDCDVIGLHRQADAILIVILQMREGKMIGSEHFSFHLIASNDEEALESFLFQNYRLRPTPPPKILLPFPIANGQSLAEILSESQQKKIEISFPQKGKKRDLIEMAERNAKALFCRELDERSLREKMLLDLQESLQLVRFPRCIECVDTSNISGTDPVASICAFVNGERDKRRTRLFRIKSAKTSDDYSSLKEVLHRHFSKEKKEGHFCDLLIVDGGKGQLHCALDVFQELGIASIDLIALTKESARHDKGLTQEKVYLPHKKEPIRIDPRSPMLFMLQRIRDEAHRLAIEFHRKRRGKRTFQSQLDEIEGIGPIKRRRLLNYFGSVRAIKAASKENLRHVDGLTRTDIERLWSFISSELKE
jgi:excinuclease ABC subunit C